jgi:hypothetical protein
MAAMIAGITRFSVKVFGGVAELLVDILRELGGRRFPGITPALSEAANPEPSYRPGERGPPESANGSRSSRSGGGRRRSR